MKMRPSFLSLATLAAGLPGRAAEAATNNDYKFPPIMSANGGREPMRILYVGGGTFNPPLYNQRKARKRARQSGIHPANAKRR